jgi:hypothetical protein
MRLPRIRLRTLMVAVAIIAVNFGLARWGEEVDARSNCVFLAATNQVLAPSLSLLTVAVAAIAVALVRRGQSSPFATGYFLLGGLASFAVCLVLATQMSDGLILRLTGIVGPNGLEPDGSLLWRDKILDSAACTLPQVVLGLIGGGLAVRFGLSFVLSGRAAARSDAIEPALPASVGNKP